MIKIAVETLPRELRELISRVAAGDIVELECGGVTVARIEPPSAAGRRAVTKEPEGSGDPRKANPSPQPGASVDGGEDAEAGLSPAAKSLLELRKGVTLGGLDWKQLRDEGRR